MPYNKLGNSRILALTCFLLNLLTFVKTYPDQVPNSACDWISPWHEPYTEPQSSSPPYQLKIYHSDVLTNMTVPMCVVGAEPFMGMMIQGQDMEGNTIGSWDIKDSDRLQTLNCNYMNDTVTHTSKKHKQIVSLRWIVPMDFQGQVVFKAAIVKSYSTFWTGIASKPFTIHNIGD